MENAGNFGSMRSTTTDSAASKDLSISFSGLLKTGDHAMSLRLSDYWRAFFDLPLQHGGSPYADSTDNQLPVTTASPAPTVPALASQLLRFLFGQ